MENTKICSKCGRELPLSEFNKCKSSKDGLQWMCKECIKQYRAEHRAERIEYIKQWHAEHPEYMKQWHADNAEYIKQYMKQYYADNADERKQYSKQYYATIEGYARRIRYDNLRKDREQGRCGKDEDPLPTIKEYIELLQQRDYYDGKQYHWSEMGLDRIDNSKAHTLNNVVPCTTEHNVQRNTKPFEEFCELMRKENELELVL